MLQVSLVSQSHRNGCSHQAGSLRLWWPEMQLVPARAKQQPFLLMEGRGKKVALLLQCLINISALFTEEIFFFQKLDGNSLSLRENAEKNRLSSPFSFFPSHILKCSGQLHIIVLWVGTSGPE